MRLISCQSVKVEPGITLGTDVFLPDGSGRYPTLLGRTPYGKNSLEKQAHYFTSHGYAVVIQNVRGRFDSDGLFDPMVHELHDGKASLDWIANQRWSNGKIGMWGLSYPGMVQWYAAIAGHEALQCIAPAVAPGSFFQEFVRYGGCIAWANLLKWVLTWTSCRTNPPQSHIRWHEFWSLRDMEAVGKITGLDAGIMEDWLERDRLDAKWKAIDVREKAGQLRVPILHTAGWWDHISATHFDLMSRPEEVPGKQYLLAGPWIHNACGGRGTDMQVALGDWSFSEAARFDHLDFQRRYFDCHLRCSDSSFENQPAVQTFIMGTNRWVTSDSWPARGSITRTFHLHAHGHAHNSEGRLSLDESDHGELTYTYNPQDPLPSRGGPIYWGLDPHYACGPVDCRPLLDRPDVAVFRTDPLPEPMVLLGPASLELNVSVNVQDTDIIARLGVQDPVTHAVCPLLVGSLQLRYRDGFTQPRPMPIDTPTRITIDLGNTGYELSAGGRLVLWITSSDAPRILPHCNRYEEGMGLRPTQPGPPAKVSLLSVRSRLNLTLLQS